MVSFRLLLGIFCGSQLSTVYVLDDMMGIYQCVAFVTIADVTPSLFLVFLFYLCGYMV